jgi:hypothetical protein
VVFGVLLLIWPVSGVLTLVWIVGASRSLAALH